MQYRNLYKKNSGINSKYVRKAKDTTKHSIHGEITEIHKTHKITTKNTTAV